MKRYAGIIILILLGCNTVSAKQITGEGYGMTRSEARKEALADLSQNIKVETQSVFSSIVTVNADDVDELKKKVINLKSDLPILGADFTTVTVNDQFLVQATLDYRNLNLYEAELINIKNIIDNNVKQLKPSRTSAEKVILLETVEKSI